MAFKMYEVFITEEFFSCHKCFKIILLMGNFHNQAHHGIIFLSHQYRLFDILTTNFKKFNEIKVNTSEHQSQLFFILFQYIKIVEWFIIKMYLMLIKTKVNNSNYFSTENLTNTLNNIKYVGSRYNVIL